MRYRLTVIVPTYNSARTLGSCIASLEENLACLDKGDVEVLVPDRNSQDATREIIRSHPRWKLLPHNMAGISRAYNLGVAAGAGAFGLFLNSDDELGPGYLQTMLSLAESRTPERHVVYSSVLFIDAEGNPLYFRHPPPYLGFLHQHHSVILHPNAIYPMPLLKKHRFDVLPGDPPRDREQVYALMKEAVWSRTRKVWYRYRIWGSSGTVRRAAQARRPSAWCRRILETIGRIYVQSYETRLLHRSWMWARGGGTHWRRACGQSEPAAL